MFALKGIDLFVQQHSNSLIIKIDIHPLKGYVAYHNEEKGGRFEKIEREASLMESIVHCMLYISDHHLGSGNAGVSFHLC